MSRPMRKSCSRQVAGEEKMTQNTTNTFKAEEFSSRKLMDLVDNAKRKNRLSQDKDMISAVVAELTTRRHYLRELRDHGLISPRRP